ncbi:glycerophosphoryl diester phosphodiesterase [Roseiarcus fermentans]|uniref:Glycerophosphoryl diester phosphodiesterase n=1 Tax=Roseiarcus fermentans TaxID=1473586 RepID=A0A366FQA5_9HYPH|nr:glycerophosphoryl diester phosphodiesterase [Roseiarcus fermentans]
MRALNAPDWLVARPIAHRGLHDAARGVIENTLAAAEAAAAATFAIECDVQLSRDETVFVFHDDTLDRLTDATGALTDKSAAEIRSARIVGAADGRAIPTLAEFLALVAGRVAIVCELKSRFDGDWRLGDRVADLAATYDGALALKSFDPDLVAYLRLKHPRLGPPGRPCPIGVVAEACYDDPSWAFLTPEQKRACETFDHRARSEPDFLSWNVDDLPHKTPFFEKQLFGLPVMTWTVRTDAQRAAARKWADQIVFEGVGGR